MIHQIGFIFKDRGPTALDEILEKYVHERGGFLELTLMKQIRDEDRCLILFPILLATLLVVVGAIMYFINLYLHFVSSGVGSVLLFVQQCLIIVLCIAEVWYLRDSLSNRHKNNLVAVQDSFLEDLKVLGCAPHKIMDFSSLSEVHTFLKESVRKAAVTTDLGSRAKSRQEIRHMVDALVRLGVIDDDPNQIKEFYGWIYASEA